MRRVTTAGIVLLALTLGGAGPDPSLRHPGRVFTPEGLAADARDGELVRFDTAGTARLAGLTVRSDARGVSFDALEVLPRGRPASKPARLEVTAWRSCTAPEAAAPSDWETDHGDLVSRSGDTATRHSPRSLGLWSSWTLDAVDPACPPRVELRLEGFEASGTSPAIFVDANRQTRLVVSHAWGRDAHGQPTPVSVYPHDGGLRVVATDLDGNGPVTLGLVWTPVGGLPVLPSCSDDYYIDPTSRFVALGGALWRVQHRRPARLRRLDAGPAVVSPVIRRDGELLSVRAGPELLWVLTRQGDDGPLEVTRFDPQTGAQRHPIARLEDHPWTRIAHPQLLVDGARQPWLLVSAYPIQQGPVRKDLYPLTVKGTRVELGPPLHLLVTRPGRVGMLALQGRTLAMAWTEPENAPLEGRRGMRTLARHLQVLRVDLEHRRLEHGPVEVASIDPSAALRPSAVVDARGTWVSVAGRVWFVSREGDVEALELSPAPTEGRKPGVRRWVSSSPRGPALTTWDASGPTLRLETLTEDGVEAPVTLGTEAPAAVVPDWGWVWTRYGKRIRLGSFDDMGAPTRREVAVPLPRTGEGLVLPGPAHVWLGVDLCRDTRDVYGVRRPGEDTPIPERVERLQKLTPGTRTTYLVNKDVSLPVGERVIYPEPVPGSPPPAPELLDWAPRRPWSLWTTDGTRLLLARLPQLEAPLEWPDALTQTVDGRLTRAWLGQAEDHGLVLWEVARPAPDGGAPRREVLARRLDLDASRWIDETPLRLGEDLDELAVDCDGTGCLVFARKERQLTTRIIPRRGVPTIDGLQEVAFASGSGAPGHPLFASSTPRGFVVCWQPDVSVSSRCERLDAEGRFPGLTPDGAGWPVGLAGTYSEISTDDHGRLRFLVTDAFERQMLRLFDVP